MTITASPRRAGPYTGNGVTTSFAFGFKVFDEADVRVVVLDTTTNVETDAVLNVDYTVTLNPDQESNPGGSVVFGTAPASTRHVTLIGSLSYGQPVDLPDGGAYRAQNVEDALDRLAIQVQQIDEKAERGLKLAVSSNNVSTTLPNAEPVNLIGWDATGAGLRNFDASELGVEIAYATWRTKLFSGDGTQVDFVLDLDAGNVSNIDLTVNNVPQIPGVNFSYTRTTKTITFLTGAPPLGTNNIAARYGEALPEPSIAAAIVQAEAARDAALAAETNAETAQVAAAGSASAAATSATNAGNSATAAAGSATAADTSATNAANSATAAATSATNAANSATAAATSASNAAATLGNSPGRNKIINGKMTIAQRGTSFAAPVSGTYTLDRWVQFNSSAAAYTVSQQLDAPSDNEFETSLRVAITTADTSIAAGDFVILRQWIEGYNARDLIGRTFTLSFRVRSSKTGVHCVSFVNTGGDRSFVAEYTVNTANTWETKSVTVTGGLITAGTWAWGSWQGVAVAFALACGTTRQTTAGAWQTGNFQATANQVNCLDTVGNVFAITGVQLEVGTVATPFEHRLHGQELALCQRYYISVGGLGSSNGNLTEVATGVFTTTTNLRALWPLPVQMRGVPTGNIVGTAGTDYAVFLIGQQNPASFSVSVATPTSITFDLSGGGISATAGQAGYLRLPSAAGRVTASAEL